ncbi:MAG TPA: flagella basal body P-ring formation protein FlgA, partial [Solibacterales bacterium]|nr:flagella basal body P-ring formation protein FlgA [Bryobacterales bacterium]
MIWLLAASMCVPLESDRIRAGDLAAAAPGFASLPAETEIALAPAFGVQRFFDGGSLARIAARFGLKAAEYRPVCFERPAATLRQEQILASLRAALEGEDFELTLLDYSRFRVPEGQLEFPKAGLPAPMVGSSSASLVWRGRVRFSGNRTMPVWARVKVAVRRDVVVVKENTAAQAVLGAETLKVERRAMHPLAAATVRSIAEAEGKLLRRSLKAGEALLPAHLAAPPDVKRGDQVEVTAREGSAEVRIVGKAFSSGSAGETVMVRNPASGK